MKRYFLMLLTASLALAAGLQSCKKCDDPANPECENYDPCLGQAPNSAAFKMYEVMPRPHFTEPVEILTGTTSNRPLLLVASDSTPGLTHSWQIGLEPEKRHGPQIRVNFRFTDALIEIVHYVEGPANSCFPGDDGRDTVRQLLKVISSNRLSEYAFLGEFEGYLSEVESTSDRFRTNFEARYEDLVLSPDYFTELEIGIHDYGSGSMLENKIFIEGGLKPNCSRSECQYSASYLGSNAAYTTGCKNLKNDYYAGGNDWEASACYYHMWANFRGFANGDSIWIEIAYRDAPNGVGWYGVFLGKRR